MKKNVNGIEMEMSPEEEAEFVASLPAPIEFDPAEQPPSAEKIASGLEAIGFSPEQISLFMAAVRS